LFYGLSKFFETKHKKHLDGTNVLKTSELEHLEKIQIILNSLGSPLNNKIHDAMKVFDCDPKWPICLYDFTY
jgi:hypothetical protein